MMEMIEIEAFLAVVHEGQITRAALLLHLSQPAVSRRIETLESELGVRLFERLPQGVRLTAAGGAFRPHAERIAAAATDALRAIRDLDEASSGQIAIALVGTLASTSLPRRLRLVRERFPAVRLTLRTARSDLVSQLVRQGEADVGLRYFLDPGPGLVSLPVGDEDLVVVAAADDPLASRSLVRPEYLAAIPWVSYPVGTASSGEPFASLLRRQLGLIGVEPETMIEIDSLTAQKRLIEAGFGVGMVPLSAIAEEVRLGTLVVLPVPDLAATVPIVAIHRRDGYLSPATRHLLATLRTGDGGET
jgi:DNA-binding transcriptional LysR family regulator